MAEDTTGWTLEPAQAADTKGWTLEAAGGARAPAAPDVSLGATDTGLFHFARHLTAGMGDKIIAGEGALSDYLHDKTGKTTVGDAYERNLAFNDKTLEVSDKVHPTARWVGNTAGVAGSTLALGLPNLLRGAGAAAATPVAGRVLGRAVAESMKVGGALGAASGFGNSRADSLQGTAEDTLEGGVDGLLAGGTLPVLGAGARAALRPLAGPLSNALERMGINAGRRALLGGNRSLSTKAPLAPEAVQEAYDSGALRPLGSTQGAFERLTAAREAHGGAYNQALGRLEDAGVQGPDTAGLAQRFRLEGLRNSAGNVNPAVPSLYADVAQQVLRKPGEAAHLAALEAEMAGLPPPASLPAAANENATLGFRQAEAIKSRLQGDTTYGVLENKPRNAALQDIASTFRQANEDAVQQQAHLAPEEAAAFVPLKQRMGRLLAAEETARRGAAKEAQRSHIGPMDLLTAAPVAASHGLGLGALTGAATHALRGRGPSTAAWAGLGLANVLRGEAPNLTPALLPTANEGFAEWLQSHAGMPALATEKEKTDARALALRGNL